MFNNKFNFLVFSALILLGVAAQAQGTMRGRISSGTDGEMLVGAAARIMKGEQLAGGAYSDLEGAYTIKGAPGTYTMIVSYLGYLADTAEITLVVGDVVVRDIILYEDVPAEGDVVEITAKANKASSATFMKKKMNSLSSIDGITNDVLQRTGDNSVAAALQRVSGVTVEGGKYVYVRGLGDRYSKTMLNGATIPSLDPDRNSVQLDLFPSNLIDNIVIHKTFTPDLPGDFTGGLVDVITRDFPDKFKMNVGYSVGYNPQANLIDNFLSYNTGGTDWLGFDDGTRDLPGIVNTLNDIDQGIDDEWADLGLLQDNPSVWQERADQIVEAGRTFATRDSIVPTPINNGLNQSLQFSIGNQHELFGRPFGYIAGFTYNDQYNQTENGLYGRWKNIGIGSTGLNSLRDLAYINSERKVVWGALAKLSYKLTDKNIISVNIMRNQGGTDNSLDYRGTFFEDNTTDSLFSSTLAYTERYMNTLQVEGDHGFGQDGKGLKVDWIASFTGSRQLDPNLRFFTYQYLPASLSSDGNRVYNIDLSNYRNPGHFYRDLRQTTNDVRLNFEVPLNIGKEEGMIKWGGAYTYTDRIFSEDRYIYTDLLNGRQFRGNVETYLESAVDASLDLIIFNGDTFPQYNIFALFNNLSEAQNQYVGDQSIWAGYVMAELPVSARLKFVTGVRFETTDMFAISEDTLRGVGDITENDFLPMFAAIYNMPKNMNLRFGYSRTLARPTFREIAPFESFGFGADYIEYGNPDLQRTLIDNLDVRWEWFPSGPEVVSVSLFYKNFTDPIQKFQVPEPQNPEFSWSNVGNAITFGTEIEVRKNLGFLGKFFEYFQVGGNVSLIRSRVDIDPDAYAEIIAIDPTRPARRPLFGQSPWAVNGELSYINPLKGWEVSLSYVNFGRRITTISLNAPDVYELPRGLLNFSASKRFGEHFRVRLRANNLLDPEYRQIQTFNNQDYVFDNYTLGRSFSLGLSYNL